MEGVIGIDLAVLEKNPPGWRIGRTDGLPRVTYIEIRR